MSEDLIHLRFPDNFGRAPLELLDSDASINARMCYVVMTSFGKESRAGKEAIRRRMGVKSLSTVKSAQAELSADGWIRRIVLGGGLKPTEWEVFWTPFGGQLPLLVNESPGHIAPRSPNGPEGATQRPTPGRPMAPKQEDKHEGKQGRPSSSKPWMSSDGKTWEEFVEAYVEAYKATRALNGLTETPTVFLEGPAGFSALKRLVKERKVPFEVFKKRLGNLGRHPFAAKKDWSLEHFCNNFREFEDGHPSLIRSGNGTSVANGESRIHPGSNRPGNRQPDLKSNF